MNPPRLLKYIALLGLISCIGCLCMNLGRSAPKMQAETSQPMYVPAIPHSPLSASISANNIVVPRVSPGNYYRSEPAPMGIADYGLDPLTNQSYMYNSSSFLGTAEITTLQATGRSYPHFVSIQLNLVLKFKVQSVVYAYWLQNVAFFDTSSNFIWFEGCIVNFSTAYPNPSTLDRSSIGGNGEIYRVDEPEVPGFYTDYYLVPPPSSTPGNNVSVTYPRTIELQTNSSIDGSGNPTVTFSYDDGFGWQIIDQVTFFIGPGNFTCWNMVVDGSQFSPNGYMYYDAEIVLCGYGDGDVANATNLDMNLFLDYYNGHNMEGVPFAYNYGDTGESISNVIVQFKHDNSTGRRYVKLQAGPGLLSGGWNSSSTAIGNFAFSNVSSGTLAVGTGANFFSGSSAQITIYPGAFPVYLNGVFITNYTFSAGLNTILIADNKIVPARGAPSNLTAIAGNSQVSLTWMAPPSNGTSVITNYMIYIGTKSGDEIWYTTIGSVTSYLITGLTNGRTYYFEVSAVNGTGEGFKSNETITTPGTVPTEPRFFNSISENGQIRLYWYVPASDELSPIIDYNIYMGMAPGGETFLTTVGGLQQRVSYMCTGLMKGPTYYFKVAAVNSFGTSLNSTEISAKAQRQPYEPTGLIATAGNAQVFLTWTAPSNDGGSPITNYTIRYDSNSLVIGNVTTYTLTGLQNGHSYIIYVWASNAIAGGAISNWVSVTPLGPPSAPQALSISGGNANATLTWNAPANQGLSSVTGYMIYCGTASNAETYFATVGNVLNYTATGLTNGLIYYFTIAAVNGEGPGTNATEVAVMPGGYPDAPQSFRATSDKTQVVLQWLPPVGDGGYPIMGYVVYSGSSSDRETILASLGVTLTFTATNLTNGQWYYFKVAAVNCNGRGPNSTEICALAATVPDAPIWSTITPGNTQVTLNWFAPVSDGGSAIRGYRVYRGMIPGGESLIAYLGLVLTYTDMCLPDGLPNGKTFYYQITAENIQGQSNLSSEVSATPANVPSVPTLTTATPGNGQVVLVWNAPGNNGGVNITGYKVYQGNWSGGEALVATLGTVLTYTATGLINGQLYYFQVSALNIMGESARSYERNAVWVITPGAPAITAAMAGNAQVTLFWTSPASNGGSAIVGYHVYQGIVPGNETLLATLGVVFTCTSTGLTNGQLYYFKVAAVNIVGTGANSTSASATPALVTVPSSPRSLAASPGYQQITLTWIAPTDDGGSAITGYKVFRGTSPGGEVLLATLGVVLTFTSTGLTNGQSYYFKVAAINMVGTGANSTEASTMPIGALQAPVLSIILPNPNPVGNISLAWTSVAGAQRYYLYESGSPLVTNNITNHEYRKRVLLTTTIYMDLELNGVHYYVVTALNSTGESICSNCQSVTVNAIAPTTAPFLYPINPNPTHVSWIYISWQSVRDVSHYRIYKSTSSINASNIGGLSPIVTVKAPRTIYQDYGVVANGTYVFAVVACNGGGNSGPSNCQQVLVILDLPSAPVLAIITPDPNAIGNITLHWNAVPGAFYYTVYVSSLFLTQADIDDFMYDNILQTSSNSYVDSEPNGVYYYVVTAWNNAGQSNCSNCQSVTVDAIAPTTAPVLQAIHPDPSGTEAVLLNWSAVSDACGYCIYSSNEPINSSNIGSLSLIAFVPAPQTTFIDSQNINGTFYYAITAYNGGGESGPSNCQLVTRLLPPIPPSTYIGVSAGDSFTYKATISTSIYPLFSILGNGTYTFVLTVESVTNNGRSTTIAYHGEFSNASGYILYTYLGSETINATDTTSGSIYTPNYRYLFFVNKNIANKTFNPGLLNDYGIFVLQYGSWDNSGVMASMLNWDNDTVGISSIRFTRMVAPGAPQALSAIVANGHVVLRWAAPASDGDSEILFYVIFRGTTPGTGVFLAVVGNVLSFNDMNVTSGLTYYYSVLAVNSQGGGSLSAEISVKMPVQPDRNTLSFVANLTAVGCVSIAAGLFLVRRKKIGHSSRRNPGALS